MRADPKVAAQHLMRRAQERRRVREAHAAEALRTVRQEVAPRLAGDARAWVVGSLAWGGYGTHSDVDVVVHGVAPRDLTAIEAALAERLGAPVDILILDDLPTDFQARVEAEGVPLHAA